MLTNSHNSFHLFRSRNVFVCRWRFESKFSDVVPRSCFLAEIYFGFSSIKKELRELTFSFRFPLISSNMPQAASEGILHGERLPITTAREVCKVRGRLRQSMLLTESHPKAQGAHGVQKQNKIH